MDLSCSKQKIFIGQSQGRREASTSYYETRLPNALAFPTGRLENGNSFDMGLGGMGGVSTCWILVILGALEGTVYNEGSSSFKFAAPSAIEARFWLLRALYSRKETIISAAANGAPTAPPTIAFCCMHMADVDIVFVVLEAREADTIVALEMEIARLVRDAEMVVLASEVLPCETVIVIAAPETVMEVVTVWSPAETPPTRTSWSVFADFILVSVVVEIMVIVVEGPAPTLDALLVMSPAGSVKVPPGLKQHESGAESAAVGQQNCPPPQ
jgi:hypothetical protein